MKPGPLDRIAERRPWQSLDGVWITLSVRERDALVEVARAARALQETEWVAFIGWQPSTDRQQAIESSAEVLAAALARLDSQ